jgi:uncharacterized protein YaiE (UPF0345 family)
MTTAAQELSQVTVKLKANVYFDGGVISHTVVSSDGRRRTIGVIQPGTYHFTTDAPERMDIIAGTCRVKLDGAADFKTFQAGQSFDVTAKSAFDIAVDNGLGEYLCTFG